MIPNEEKLLFVNGINKMCPKIYRKLPWREARSPWVVYLFESMLQKTTSKQVLHLSDKLLSNFSSPKKVLNTDLSFIENTLKPLGLYKKRASNLKKVAEQILNKYNGTFPSNYSDIISLPGIGKYLANAILCFALNERVEIVDSNVIRIFKRFFGISSKYKRFRDDPAVWHFAKSLLPEEDYKKYNYCLLDFGSSVCTVHPLCSECTLKGKCRFHNKEKNS